jgi:ABC-type lipoprotein release transport system permease subunit
LRRSRTRLSLLLYLARRSLFASKLTFALLVVAIAAGAGFQIPNTANLAGFSAALLQEGLVWGAGDIRIEPRDRARFTDGDAEAAKLGALIDTRASAVLVYAGAIGKRGRFLGTPVYGIDPGLPTPFHVVDGTVLAAGDTTGVLVGSSLAKRLELAVGDTIDARVIFGPLAAALDDDNIGRFKLTVRGIVVGAAGGYRFIFVDRGFLAREAGDPKAASTIVVHLDDHEDAQAKAARINAEAPEAQALAWRDDDPYLPNYLRANKIINTVSYAMVVAAISIPVWALLYIHVLNRRRELGILAALGFGRREIFAIYVLQSLVVAVVGSLIGAGLGFAMIQYFDGHPIFEWEGLVVRPLASAGSFLGPAAVVTLTALVAGAYPAWSASRTDPAKVLRRIE